MALNIRKTKFNDPKDMARMFVDAKDFSIFTSEIRNLVLQSEEAMNYVANNLSIMNNIANSELIMNEVANSSVAMKAIANSSTAMNAVSGSSVAMNAIMSNSTAANIWFGSSYYIGLGLATYDSSLSHSTFDFLQSMNDVANNSVAMSALNASATTMPIVMKSCNAMNSFTTLTAYNTFKTATEQLSLVQTLVSDINAGTILLATVGDETHLSVNALLVILTYDNGAAVPAGNATNSPTPTLTSKIRAVASSTTFTMTTTGVTLIKTLATNEIVFALFARPNFASYVVGVGTGSTYDTSGTSGTADDIAYTVAGGGTGPNESTSPLLLSGTLYGENNKAPATVYYISYIPA